MIQRLCPICRLPPLLCAGFSESCNRQFPLPPPAEEKRP